MTESPSAMWTTVLLRHVVAAILQVSVVRAQAAGPDDTTTGRGEGRPGLAQAELERARSVPSSADDSCEEIGALMAAASRRIWLPVAGRHLPHAARTPRSNGDARVGEGVRGAGAASAAAALPCFDPEVHRDDG